MKIVGASRRIFVRLASDTELVCCFILPIFTKYWPWSRSPCVLPQIAGDNQPFFQLGQFLIPLKFKKKVL